jgi:hypothetical protein
MLREKAKSVLSIPGISEDGASWLAKALHPSDNVPKIVGIPTMDAVPTACVNYTNTYIISAPTGQASGSTWDCVISAVQHPISFGKVRCIGSNGSAPIYSSTALLNTQLGGTGTEANVYESSQKQWDNSVTKYRPMYMGATYTLTAPTLSDQGTVASTQLPLDTSLFTLPSTTMVFARNLEVLPDFDFPGGVANTPEFSFSSIQGTPGAYTASAREGGYVVMKLDQDSLIYRSAKRTIVPATQVDTLSNPLAPFVQEIDLTTKPVHPYIPDALVAFSFSPSTFSTVDAVVDRGSDMMGLTYFKGLSSAATVTVTTRVGFECVVPSSSILLPSVEKACRYDKIALEAYWCIQKEMLGCYPASYNFLGTLWSVIKSVGQAVLPGIVDTLGGMAKKAVAPAPPPPPPPIVYQVQRPAPSYNQVSMARPKPSIVSSQSKQSKQLLALRKQMGKKGNKKRSSKR